jgi:hypothetical protein
MEPPRAANAEPSPAPPTPRAASTSPPPESEAGKQLDSRATGSPLAAEFFSRSGNAARDVQIVHEMLRLYLRAMHQRQGFPIGNDSDLVRVLTGHNPMHLVILPSDHPGVRADGRLCDRWGTPIWVHARGNNAFEIRSAGPDLRMFTSDDLVANPAPAAAR